MAERHTTGDGAFSFRYRSCEDGGITLWLRVLDQPEIGPVHLERTAADTLGALLERAIKLVSDAQGRRSVPWEPHDEPLDDLEPLGSKHTDPFALKPRSR